MNIFASDLYRIRKGGAVRGTLIGLVISIVFLGFMFLVMTSDGMTVFIDEASKMQGVTNAEVAEMQDEMSQLDQFLPQNAADFTKEMIMVNMLIFFLLPFVVSIFSGDYGNGTYRNTLSFESNRTRVYLQKLALGVCCCLGLNVALVLLSILVGGLMFGFTGLTASFFLSTIVSVLLLLPTQLASLSFGFCLTAFTKKTSSTIAIYLIGLTVLSSIIQTLSMFGSFQWLSLLDWNGVGKLMINYQTMPAADIIVSVGGGLLIAAVAALVGVNRYRTTDMA